MLRENTNTAHSPSSVALPEPAGASPASPASPPLDLSEALELLRVRTVGAHAAMGLAGPVHVAHHLGLLEEAYFNLKAAIASTPGVSGDLIRNGGIRRNPYVPSTPLPPYHMTVPQYLWETGEDIMEALVDPLDVLRDDESDLVAASHAAGARVFTAVAPAPFQTAGVKTLSVFPYHILAAYFSRP